MSNMNIFFIFTGKYVQSLFFTSTPGPTRKLLKKDKIKLGKLKLIKEKMLKLEERLGITTIPPSTTTEPTTEPYTGPSTRVTLTSFFDPDYIFDPHYPLREVKRLKRDIPDTNSINNEGKVSSYNSEPKNVQMQKVGTKSNGLNIFPPGDLTWKNSASKDSKLWIKSKREEYGLGVLKMEHKNLLETNRKRTRRDTNNLKSIKLRFSKKRYFSNENHVLVKRDLGKIVRRSTKRPFLSRRFKSHSMKRYREDMRLAQMITEMQSNITIIPEFLMMSQVLADFAKHNLSTLFYVYNDVAYFGSVPPHLLTTKPTVLFTKGKSMTYELGATQVLGRNIFNEKKRDHKVSPGDVDIPNIDIEQQTQTSEPKTESIKGATDTEITEKTKLRRTRKKKNGDNTESSRDSSKKTRVKRKSTKAINIQDSLENSVEKDASSSKVKGNKRKARSLGLNAEDAERVMEALPTFLCLIHNNMHLRKKRNTHDEEETKKIELEEKSKVGHFGKLKESLKRSKNNMFAYVREKKESFIDMPRRARYIAREMYLDGKFFFRELKEVPDRMKKDFQEKKDLMKLVWDMLKIFMPVTEKGEKGGTTPETKIVEDPKQYVKNPGDYITPDLSDLNGPPKTSLKCEAFEKTEPKTERTTVTEPTSTKTTSKQTETKTTPVTAERRFNEKTKKTTIVETSTVWTFTEDLRKLSSLVHNEPVLITDEPNTIKTYHTRVVGPDYVPTNTRRNDESDEGKTTRKLSKFDTVIEKVKDEKTFDRLSETMKNKEFMNNVFKNADTNRLKDVMADVKPQDVLSKLDEKTILKMGKLMTELDTDTIRQMQDLVMKTTNFGGTGNKIVKTR